MKLVINNIIPVVILFFMNIYCTNTDKNISSGEKETFAKDSIKKENALSLTPAQKKILNGAKTGSCKRN